MADIIGTMMGRYQILALLGEGGMAAVYKAYDTRLARQVALKVITDTRQESDHFLKRFEREAKSLAKLSHPNIVGVHDYGEHDGHPYIVMEYLPNGTLKKFMGLPINYRRASELLLPVAEALAYAHSQGIIHRDIKPANILLSALDIPMVTDFGIAKVFSGRTDEQLTQVGSGIGTPSYMAPEQGQGLEIDQRADIYALGVVFYEMLTGRKPYEAPTPTGVFWKQMTEPLPNPKLYIPELPDSVVQFLQKSLAVNVNERLQSMSLFAENLKSFIAGKAPDYKEAPTSIAPRQQQATMVEPTPTPFPGIPTPTPQPQSRVQTPTQAPSIATPVFHYDEVNQLPPMPTGQAAAPPVKKKKTGLILGIIGGAVVLGILCIIGIIALANSGAKINATATAEAELAALRDQVATAESQAAAKTETAENYPTPTISVDATPVQATPEPAENAGAVQMTSGAMTQEEWDACIAQSDYGDYQSIENAVPVLCDNFNDNRFNWYLGPVETDYINGNSWIENGVMHLEMTAKDVYTQHWKWIADPLTGEDLLLEDLMVVFKIRKISGGEGLVGIDYRETEDSHFYSTTIYENTDSYTLEYFDGENYFTLAETTISDWIDSSWNQLGIGIMDQNHFAMANNTELEIEDSQNLSSGTVSLWIGAVNANDTVVYEIDDVVVFQVNNP